MPNKQRPWLLVVAALVFGTVAAASIAYAENSQSDPTARSKKKTNDEWDKRGQNKSIRMTDPSSRKNSTDPRSM